VRGVALCGLSAGSMCWFRHGITKSGGPPELVDAVSARPESRAYRVQRRDGAGAVTAIPVRHLSAPYSGVKAPPPEVAELRELRAARRGGRYAS